MPKHFAVRSIEPQPSAPSMEPGSTEQPRRRASGARRCKVLSEAVIVRKFSGLALFLLAGRWSSGRAGFPVTGRWKSDCAAPGAEKIVYLLVIYIFLATLAHTTYRRICSPNAPTLRSDCQGAAKSCGTPRAGAPSSASSSSARPSQGRAHTGAISTSRKEQRSRGPPWVPSPSTAN